LRLLRVGRGFRHFLDVDRSTVAQETGAVEGDRFTALQAAGDFDQAALLAADLDDLLPGLAVGDQVDDFARRAQDDRLF
jgi:hypothetical protein